MATRKFRSFLYLDEGEVDDIIAQFEGGLLEGPQEETEKTSGRNSTDDTAESIEVHRRRSETPQVRFNRLYDFMEEDGSLKKLGEIDQAQYNDVTVGEIIEVRGLARLPEWEHFKHAFTEIAKIVPFMQSVGQDPLKDPTTREAFEGFGQLTSMSDQEDTMLIVTPPGLLKAKVVAKLKHGHLGRSKGELEGEVIMVGKVRRRLEKGQQIEAYRLLPNLQGLQTLNQAQANRAQRRQASKKKSQQAGTDTTFDEVVKYPAIEVLPIAIFQ